jgi:hypothetical protein
MALEIAQAVKIPVQGMNVERVGTSDTEPVRDAKVPTIDFHGLTNATWPILHTIDDQFSKVQGDVSLPGHLFEVSGREFGSRRERYWGPQVKRPLPPGPQPPEAQNVEITRWAFSAPQAVQREGLSASAMRRNFSNRAPHSGQAYSYIGIL